MQSIDFTGIHKINCNKISRSSSLAFASFLIFGAANLAGLAAAFGNGLFFKSPQVTIESLAIIIGCLLTSLAFRKASASYSVIAGAQETDLEQTAAAGQQLQKAFTWTAVVIALILIRSIQFHMAFDMIGK